MAATPTEEGADSLSSLMGGRRGQLSEDEVRELADAAESIHVPAGTRLFSEGQRVDFLALIEHGEIELYHLANRRRVVYEILRRGDLVGAVPFLTESASAFSARVAHRRTSRSRRTCGECRGGNRNGHLLGEPCSAREVLLSGRAHPVS